jgi:hypothetical protein
MAKRWPSLRPSLRPLFFAVLFSRFGFAANRGFVVGEFVLAHASEPLGLGVEREAVEGFLGFLQVGIAHGDVLQLLRVLRGQKSRPA